MKRTHGRRTAGACFVSIYGSTTFGSWSTPSDVNRSRRDSWLGLSGQRRILERNAAFVVPRVHDGRGPNSRDPSSEAHRGGSRLFGQPEGACGFHRPAV